MHLCKTKLNLHDPIKSLCKKIKLNACECAFTVPFYVLFSEYQLYVFNSSVFCYLHISQKRCKYFWLDKEVQCKVLLSRGTPFRCVQQNTKMQDFATQVIGWFIFYVSVRVVRLFFKRIPPWVVNNSTSVFITSIQMGTRKLERKCNETAAVNYFF